MHRSSITDEVAAHQDSQTVLPSAEMAAMLFWALLVAGRIVMRKVDGWQTIAEAFAEPSDLAA